MKKEILSCTALLPATKVGVTIMRLNRNVTIRRGNINRPQSAAPKIQNSTCYWQGYASFFDHCGPLHLKFNEPRVNINALRYSETLILLRIAIKNKLPEMLTDGVILLHNNAGRISVTSSPHI